MSPFFYPMIITSFTCGPFAENTFLLEKDGKALLVDPGFSTAHEWHEARQSLIEYDLELIGILLTHGHLDHIMGVDKVVSVYKVPVHRHPESQPTIDRYPESSAMFGFPQPPVAFRGIDMLPSADVHLGPFSMEARYTPGHAAGHLSFYFPNEGLVLAGDALFKESIGRTDLPGGDYTLLQHSIHTQLLTLPDDTVVYSGHGPKTTIGHERKVNPFLQALR
jgi:hydroxyacylglutathione hydrolase